MIDVLAVSGVAKFLTVLATGIGVGSIATLVALGFMLIFKATTADIDVNGPSVTVT